MGNKARSHHVFLWKKQIKRAERKCSRKKAAGICYVDQMSAAYSSVHPYQEITITDIDLLELSLQKHL